MSALSHLERLERREENRDQDRATTSTKDMSPALRAALKATKQDIREAFAKRGSPIRTAKKQAEHA